MRRPITDAELAECIQRDRCFRGKPKLSFDDLAIAMKSHREAAGSIMVLEDEF